MKTNLKSLMIVGMALILSSFAVTSWAACGTSQLIGNYSTGAQLNVAGILDDGSGMGTILTKFWIAGKSTEHNSGTLPSIYQSMPWGTNTYYIWSNFGNGAVVGDCASPTEKAMFLYSIQNNGQGQYILMGTAMDTYTWVWDFDAITNGNGPLGPNTEVPINIPALNVASPQVSGDIATVSLSWTPIGNLKGFYDVEPASNLITGLAIRYFQGTTAPVSFKTSDWPVAGVVNFGANGTDPGYASVQVPYDASMKTYVALTILFDGGQPGGFTETAFVGAPTEVVVAPVAKPTFTSVTATSLKKVSATQVAWSVQNEGALVENYTVLASRNTKGPFAPVSGAIAPSTGNYSVMVSSTLSVYQVVALLTDGTTVASPVVRASN